MAANQARDLTEDKEIVVVPTKTIPQGITAVINYMPDVPAEENLEAMKECLKAEQVTFVFECVDMKNDPHIIEYPQSELFLLDVVHNDINFKKYAYEELIVIGQQFGLKTKEKAIEMMKDFKAGINATQKVSCNKIWYSRTSNPNGSFAVIISSNVFSRNERTLCNILICS